MTKNVSNYSTMTYSEIQTVYMAKVREERENSACVEDFQIARRLLAEQFEPLLASKAKDE